MALLDAQDGKEGPANIGPAATFVPLSGDVPELNASGAFQRHAVFLMLMPELCRRVAVVLFLFLHGDDVTFYRAKGFVGGFQADRPQERGEAQINEDLFHS